MRRQFDGVARKEVRQVASVDVNGGEAAQPPAARTVEMHHHVADAELVWESRQKRNQNTRQ